MDKAKELLRKLRKHVNGSQDAMMVNAIYISPSQAMRNAANEMDVKDALLREVDEFLSK